MSNATESEPMESHGLRLPPQMWRAIETRARLRKTDRSDWLRTKIGAVLELEPDMHDMELKDHVEHEEDCLEVTD
jgi:hypothetical protein